MPAEKVTTQAPAPEIAAKLQLGLTIPGEMLGAKLIEAWIVGRQTQDTDIRREWDLIGVRIVKRMEVVCNHVWDLLGFPKLPE